MKLEDKLNKLEELAQSIQNEQSIEKAIGIFGESVNLAAECLATLNDCKGQLVVLQERMKELESDD